MTSNFVPTSLQRIRRFLADKGRFKVKPWADVETTLEGFRSTLYRKRCDEAFWEELKSLLSQLHEDTERRLEADEIGLIQNEVLDPERRNQLLDEIRCAIAVGPEIEGGFRALSNQLSAQAFSLLLILGSTTTVGCYDSRRNNVDSAVMGDSGPDDDNSASENATGGSDMQKDITGGSGETIEGTGGVDTAYSGASGFSSRTVDAGIPVDDYQSPFTERPSAGTLEEMARECMPEATELREEVFKCIDALHESWRTGLTEYFRNNSCNKIRDALDLLQNGFDCGGPPPPCSNPANAGEFDVDAIIDNCFCCIYVGVRFE